MRALTVRQPWGWAVAQGLKPIENRTWPPLEGVREFAVHAGLSIDHAGYQFPAMRNVLDLDEPYGAVHVTGAIIGYATILGAHPDGGCRFPGSPCAAWGMPSPRWSGDEGRDIWHWRVHGSPLAEPVPCRGALGLWTVPPDVERLVAANLS